MEHGIWSMEQSYGSIALHGVCDKQFTPWQFWQFYTRDATRVGTTTTFS
jgi:hypothetical protein